MKEILIPLVSFLILGGLMGLMLAFAAKFFAVKTDPKIEEIQAVLPGANCGGCGYAGCAALAQAIAEGKAPLDSCPAGGAAAAAKISKIMGVEFSGTTAKYAVAACGGCDDKAKKKYIYEGLGDCISASKLGGGDKSCIYGCLGLGSCAAVCRFNAIKIENGVAVIDSTKCVGCGVCAATCPKKIIKLVNENSKVFVNCSSKDKGPVVRKICDAGCIGCKLCEKNCESGAIKAEGLLATIDYDKCTNCGKCAEVCPRKCIINPKKDNIKEENSDEIAKV